jgi:hypothetical protein
MFRYRHNDGTIVIASQAIERDGQLWQHVSVSVSKHKLPTWDCLCSVRDIFLGPETLAIQVLAPRGEWVNDCNTCLHLWCCPGRRIVPDLRRGGTL